MHAPPAARTLALLRRHGWNATSFQVLGPGYRYWFDGDEACVAYWDTGRAWVAAGAPIAPTHAVPEAARRFVAAAQAARRRACFFATESRFAAHPALDGAAGGPLASLRIGEQPVWDPAAWTRTVHAAAGLRAQLGRARAKGVTVRALAPAELAAPGAAARAAVERLIGGWLATRRLPPMAFLLQVTAFDHLDERRCFVAEREGRVVGFLSAAPVYARGGWLIQDLLRASGAPNGTNELFRLRALRRRPAVRC